MRAKVMLYDSNHELTQLLTHLFSDAEERELSDEGVALGRVVQDQLLALGVNGLEERPLKSPLAAACCKGLDQTRQCLIDQR